MRYEYFSSKKKYFSDYINEDHRRILGKLDDDFRGMRIQMVYNFKRK